jgi:UDP-N-acetylglucosamine/UDP-N-acetylgalactosamine diphosphorylase
MIGKMEPMPPVDTPVRSLLEAHGQEHLLDGVDQLDPAVRDRFVARLAEVDWAELERPAQPPRRDEVEPAQVLTLDQRAGREDELREAGEREYRSGDVAVLMVAGGEGTRLGFSGPKGLFPLGPLSGKSLYQLQAEKVVSLSRRVGRAVPLLVMTSPATDDETRGFFAAHDGFGLGASQLRFLTQGTVPSTDRQGRALLAGPGELLENPDGHGGVFPALVASGALEELRRDGVEWLVYLQVDNALAPIDDPVLVGLATREDADAVTKVLEKAHPDERVGHLVRAHGRDRIVEYTELTAEQTRARGPDGHPVYRWGSPALHTWSTAFFDRLAETGYRPPLHRSVKPLQAWRDGSVRELEGLKHERFVFDLLTEAERSVGLEIDRAAEYAPLKNAEGDDSLATARAGLHSLHASWLETAGVEVAPDARVEISPLYAATLEQLLERWDGRLDRVEGDRYVEP